MKCGLFMGDNQEKVCLQNFSVSQSRM